MYFPTAVVLAAFPFLAGAVPVQDSLREFISIPLSKRSTFHNTDGLVDIAGIQASTHHTMTKFRGLQMNTDKRHPLASKQKHPNKRHVGTVPLELLKHPPMSSIWVGNISIGTPPQDFTVLFDTLSTDLFLPGIFCLGCEGHRVYNPTLSSTAVDLGQPKAAIIKPNGSLIVEAQPYMDNVFIGKFEATNQTLGVVLIVGDNFNNETMGADGILGLGFWRGSSFGTHSLVWRLIHEHRLREPVFGLALAGSNPELILGGRDRRRYKGDLVCSNPGVHSPNSDFWQTKFDSITVNGVHIPVNGSAVIDTGTDVVLGDRASVFFLYENIPRSSSNYDGDRVWWTVPCDTDVNVSIKVGGTDFIMSPTLGPISDGSDMCWGAFATALEIKVWSFGNIFLKNVYAEFNLENHDVCFASRK